MAARILVHIVELDTGDDIRIRASIGARLGSYQCPVSVGDRVSIRASTGQVSLAKRAGVGT